MRGNLPELWGGGLGAAVAPLETSAVVSKGRRWLPVIYLPESQLCSPRGLSDVSSAQGPPLV